MEKRGIMKINLLLVVLFLAFVGISCSDSGDRDVTADLDSGNQPRFASTIPTPEPTVEPNNNPDYWETCCGRDLYTEKYEHLAPENEADLKKLTEMAHKSEANFLKSEMKAQNLSDLEYALIFYSRVALKDSMHLEPALINLEKGIKFKVDPLDLAESTLALSEKYPNNAKLKSFLPAIRKAILIDLKEEQRFDVTKSYATAESWSDDSVYGQGVYAIRNIEYLSRIAKKTGDKAGHAKWERYKAEYELTGHSFDGVYADNDPRISYEIYTNLKDSASAKKAAVLVGHKFLEVYMRGSQNILGHSERTFGIPYDLEQASLWFAKGGLNSSEIAEAIYREKLKALASLPECLTRKECATEDWDNKEFLENLKIEAIS